MAKLPQRVYLTPAQAIVWSTLTPLGPHEYERIGHCRECRWFDRDGLPATNRGLLCLESIPFRSVPQDGSGFCHEFEEKENVDA